MGIFGLRLDLSCNHPLQDILMIVNIIALHFFFFAENTRAAYPIEYIPNAKLPCVGPHPKNVILLACDAFGVLPPVSKLNLAQTMYHFISGYTALVMFQNSYLTIYICYFVSSVILTIFYLQKLQVAGTEDGIKEPQATFSACFGAAFIMLHPTKYAAMLAEKMQKHGATGWLVNTGWSAGRCVIITLKLNFSLILKVCNLYPKKSRTHQVFAYVKLQLWSRESY